MHCNRHRFIAFATFLCLAGCAEPLILERTPDTVSPTWDPVDSVLPTPTDLVRNEDTGRLELPVDGDITPAEAEFRRYLNFLDGYPLQSSINIPMDAPVSANALGASIFLADLDSGERIPLEVEFDPIEMRITANATGEDGPLLQNGRRYAMALAGYEKGMVGANGEAVVADAAFYLVRSESPLTEHPDAMPGESREEKHEAAERLEELQDRYRPYFDVFANFGVEKREIAVLSKFTTTSAPAVWFDSDAGEIPIPNDVLVDPDTGLVDVPIREDDDLEAEELKHKLSTYDGFATTAPITFSATRNVEPQTVTTDTVRLYRFLENGEFLEVNEVERGVLDDGRTVWVKPDLALEDDTQYALVVTRGVTAGGVGLEAQPIAALLRSTEPLIVDGEPQVGVLDQESAELLEPLRSKLVPLLDKLEAEGLSRSDIAAAVPFETLSALEGMLELRASLYERDVSTELRNVVVQTPLERGLPVIMRDVETIVSGEVTTLDYLDPATRRFRDDMVAEERSISFVATIPEGVSPGEPIPTVMFGHGLFTSRELLYMIANKLADNGYAAVAIDMPYHGRRSVCLGPSDCIDSMCNELGQCVKPDGSRGELTTLAGPWPDGPEFPTTTGSAFVEVTNIVGSRDHFAQAIVDQCQALRVIRGADWASASGGYVLDGNDVVYLGMSLGGIIGSMLAGVEPTLTDFVLNVPGGNLFQLLTNSNAFQTAFQSVLDRRMIERDTDEYFEFETGLRWLLDDVDPVNLAHHGTIAPFEYVDPIDGQTKMSPVKRVLIQMAEEDLVVPNVATQSLSTRMEVPIRTYTPAVSNHAFLFDPLSLEGARARDDVVEFFDGR